MAEMPKRGRRKTVIGEVVSDRAHKTILVEITRRVPHPLYGKVMRRRSRFAAHDDGNEARRGDTVMVMETRPLSKSKRWRLVEILEKAE